ncbi:MAG TPA: carbamoyl-phosphate synthase large subunit, partial [Lactobacillus sp.]|nr:carbamoyl-phosphate synthase large subunit [Lactobacillus sp.]
AKMAAKIAVGLHLDEIINPVTGTTTAEFEPALDYAVVKIPRWPFDKFPLADRQLGTQMKATGEVMAIGRNFEEALNKAVRSLEIRVADLRGERFEQITTPLLLASLMPARDDRLFRVAELLRRGVAVADIHAKTEIDLFFLNKILHIVRLEAAVSEHVGDETLMRTAKENGLSDALIAELWQWSFDKVRQWRQDHQVTVSYNMVDTVAAEFDSQTPYYYATYDGANEAVTSTRASVLVLGSGPIRIGQGVEFDYATVHAVKAIQQAGYEAIIMNSNPETVSTDFSISDKLYFEPLTLEDVLNVVEQEKPLGVMAQFGGQTAINLAQGLADHGIKVLGTSVADMNRAEDRQAFDEVIKRLRLPQPMGMTATTVNGAVSAASEIGYPVLIRPSYVLGGRAMEIVADETELRDYMVRAVQVSNDHPVLIDSYLEGAEAELDVISDGDTAVIPGLMEHIERAGVHSGDSMAVYPPQHLSNHVKQSMVQAAIDLAKALNVCGMMNVQFVIHHDKAYVIEVNPRASRTVPFIAKVTHTPIAQLAARVMLGDKLADMGFTTGLLPDSDQVAVKAPIFSFAKLPEVDALLGPEMKSTGEVMGMAPTFEKALYKAFIAAGIQIPTYGRVLITVADRDKQDALSLARRLADLGYDLVSTKGTGEMLKQAGISADVLGKVSDAEINPVTEIHAGQLQMVINTTRLDESAQSDSLQIREAAIANGVPLFTALDTVAALLTVLESRSLGVAAM